MERKYSLFNTTNIPSPRFLFLHHISVPYIYIYILLYQHETNFCTNESKSTYCVLKQLNSCQNQITQQPSTKQPVCTTSSQDRYISAKTGPLKPEADLSTIESQEWDSFASCVVRDTWNQIRNRRCDEEGYKRIHNAFVNNILLSSRIVLKKSTSRRIIESESSTFQDNDCWYKIGVENSIYFQEFRIELFFFRIEKVLGMCNIRYLEEAHYD